MTAILLLPIVALVPAASASAQQSMPEVTEYNICDGSGNCLNNNGIGSKVQAEGLSTGWANYTLTDSQNPCPGLGAGTTCYQLEWKSTGDCLQGQSDGTILTEKCNGGEAELWTHVFSGSEEYLVNVYHAAHGGAFTMSDDNCKSGSNAFLTSTPNNSCDQNWALISN